MPDSMAAVENRLAELEKEISETRKRLPAHSVKPTIMYDLLELEDERDLLLARKTAILNSQYGPSDTD